MNLFKRKRLFIATAVYWVLLVYIISLLLWWFIALQTQSRQMSNYRLLELKMDDPAYEARLNAISAEEDRKTAQYIGEGSTFLFVILVGAIFVYREVRRQIRLQVQQQNFMMAVTHELKTPIAVTKLNLETLQKHRLDEQKQQKIIRSALQETDRLDALANNILVASQMEGGAYIQAKEELDFPTLVGSTMEDFIRRFPERKWQFATGPAFTILGDPFLLRMLINNLVENAIKYSPRESTIAVTLKNEGAHPVLLIKDEGAGIKDEEKKKIFSKFYRSGNEKTRNTQGTGLGLYLCRKIANDHKASIGVSDNSPAGSIFTVIF
ncbi:MAG TPA: ATP-binding protein [Puia sp.]|nr:ATP-binding protein [Puia sp.]